MFVFTFKLTVLAVLAMVRLLNVLENVPPIDCAIVLLKVTVAVPAVKAFVALLFVQLPFIERLKFHCQVHRVLFHC